MPRLTVRISLLAVADVDTNHDWWAENRSTEQAERWYLGVHAAMQDLSKTALRHPLATEPALRNAGIQQASFSIGRRPTHRILFRVDGDHVMVLRVRAFKQDTIRVDELAILV